MLTSRRLIVLAAVLAVSQATFAAAPATTDRADRVRAEHQPIADLGNGTFRNPILSGHWHDPTVLRVGADYYMTHCEHDNRGPILWHSRDLVNWAPLTRIESLAGYGNIWATDLVYHHGLYYLYLPLRLADTADGKVSFTNAVITAKDPAGPWSQLVDLHVGGIDPGHVVDKDGTRYLYVNRGEVVQLSPDGLSTVGSLRKVYDGWPIPPEWVIECDCLESPKLFWRGGWCYLVSALGGTAGPSTSHMVVVARAKSAVGPWENAPRSPLLRTADRNEPWWSQGHGTIVEATDGSWWMLYHGIQNGLRSLGRNTVMLPITWTADGWPQIPAGVTAASTLPKPAGENVGHGMPLSDDFTGPAPGIQWDPLEAVPDFATRYRTANGRLLVQAKGDSIRSAARLAIMPANVSYEVQVAVDVPAGAEAGLMILGGDAGATGLGVHDGRVYMPRRGNPVAPTDYTGRTVHLKLVNRDHDVACYHSADGVHWTKFEWGAGVSSENSLRIALYASGRGEVVFRSFRYRGLD